MRAVIATIAPLVLLIVHTLLGYSNVNPIGPLVGQGLSYSGFAAVLWPSIPLVVEPKYIGLGYGFVTAIQNIGLACFPLIIAQIYDSSNQHYIPNVELFFMMLAVGGTLVGLYLNYYDMHHHHVFNAPGKPVLVEGETVAEHESDTDKLQGGDGGGAIMDEEEEEAAGEERESLSALPPTGLTHRHPNQTFTAHEEIFRARVASGDISIRQSSRDSSSRKSADILTLQHQYNPLTTSSSSTNSRSSHGGGLPRGSTSSNGSGGGGSNKRSTSAEIFATSGIH